MIENALSVAGKDEWFASTDVLQVLKDLGGVPTLRLLEINDGLVRLLKDGRLDVRAKDNQTLYKLGSDALRRVEANFDESSRRLERVLNSLYRGVLSGQSPITLAEVFLVFICEVLQSLGAQWASYITGTPLHSLMSTDDVEEIADRVLSRHSFPPDVFAAVKRRSVGFFHDSDPDYDYIKFALGQSFYVSRLLGVDGRDYLAEDIFSDGTLYLDSSVVIPALLPGARHHHVFRELCSICRKLRIQLKITRPTVDEVRWVAAGQERTAEQVYDNVPEKLAPRVRGDFFQTYVLRRKADPDFSVSELFAPFRDLARTLDEEFGVSTVDDERFERFLGTPEFEAATHVLQDCSERIRKRRKHEETLAHDAKVYLFLQSQVSVQGDKVWHVSRDTSLPPAWGRLQAGASLTRCFMLDGLLQSISPFVLADKDVEDFSRAFSQIVSAQLLPQGKLFDVDDFLLFQDLELDCREIPEDELEDCLISIKEHVLKGASYRKENFEDAAYELRRFFAQRKERLSSLIKERDSAEARLRESEQAHGERIQQLEEEHSRSREDERKRFERELEKQREETEALRCAEEARQRRKAGKVLLAKKCLAATMVACSVLLGTYLANRWGVGNNIFQRLVSSIAIFVPFIGCALLVAKVTLFPSTRLTDVFTEWDEIRDLFR